MSIEFAGIIPTQAEAGVPRLHEHRRESDLAQSFARAGFDNVLIEGTGALGLARGLSADRTAPKLIIQHRPNEELVEAAEAFALLDCRAASGLSVEIVGEPTPSERASFVHETDQARTDEYLTLLKRLWLNDKAIDYEGRFFSLRGAKLSARRCHRTLPLMMGGRSAVAIRVAARHADVFKLGGVGLSEANDLIAQVEAAAIPFGRSGRIRYSLDIQPSASPLTKSGTRSLVIMPPRAVLEVTGRAEDMVLHLLPYIELGVSHFTVRGLQTPEDVANFGVDVISLLRRTQERTVHHRFGLHPAIRLMQTLL
ncbi:LLM class flavin-dependent oxidoreductase [Tianweitania sp.]|uniref:LLM class flavin-dependent oxidoreductase n=1 Tax=Tianweitania sp. TaxID=2021634 RepID=UPI00289D9058|nr:LLM class flavin-dependent oxidoreductase [Tianweitania sp.]